jgi:hypothetical protein
MPVKLTIVRKGIDGIARAIEKLIRTTGEVPQRVAPDDLINEDRHGLEPTR